MQTITRVSLVALMMQLSYRSRLASVAVQVDGRMYWKGALDQGTRLKRRETR
jgi:hypothetical protein